MKFNSCDCLDEAQVSRNSTVPVRVSCQHKRYFSILVLTGVRYLSRTRWRLQRRRLRTVSRPQPHHCKSADWIRCPPDRSQSRCSPPRRYWWTWWCLHSSSDTVGVGDMKAEREKTITYLTVWDQSDLQLVKDRWDVGEVVSLAPSYREQVDVAQLRLLEASRRKAGGLDVICNERVSSCLLRECWVCLCTLSRSLQGASPGTRRLQCSPCRIQGEPRTLSYKWSSSHSRCRRGCGPPDRRKSLRLWTLRC